VLNRPTSNYQTFRLNIYQTSGDTSTLQAEGQVIDAYGYTLLVFDIVKLVMYTVYFGKQQINDFANLYKNCYQATFGDYSLMFWNFLVSYFNIGNFILFIILSRNYDVNELLRQNKFVNSQEMSGYYQVAQLYDSILVIMNMLMLVQFTVISRRVSLVFKIIGITVSYLVYLVLCYLLMLLLMAMIVW
jgi:hypothetical protein